MVTACGHSNILRLDNSTRIIYDSAAVIDFSSFLLFKLIKNRSGLTKKSPLTTPFYQKRESRSIGKTVVALLTVASLLATSLTYHLPPVQASPGTQIKTVEYFLYQSNSLAQLTNGNGVDNTPWGAACGASDSDPSVSITIPESGVMVRNAIVEWRTVSTGTNNKNVTDYDIQFCNSSTTAADSGTGVIARGTAENQELVVWLEASPTILAGTNTYWFDARTIGDTRNTDSLKIYITYEYDETSSTQLKTVRFFGAQGNVDNIDAVVSPNLTEAGIVIRDSWAEFHGQVGSSNSDFLISGSFTTSSTCSPTSNVATVDQANKSAYSYTILYDMSNTINATGDNCIRYRDTNIDWIWAKHSEWVITYEYSHFATTNTSHTNTVRLHVGTRQAPLPGGAWADIGNQSITLPENLPASPFTSVYARYHTSIGELAGRFNGCISTASGCSGTASATGQINLSLGGVGEATGGDVVLDDVTAFFNANWSNPTTFYFSAGDSSISNTIWGTSVELVITYKYNANTTSTIAKTVYFGVGQETLRRTNAFNQDSEPSQANFTTYWPETGTKTFRSGAVYANFASDRADSANTETNTITIDDTAIAGTDVASVDYRGTDENHSREHLVGIVSQVPSPFAAQSNINFSLTRADSNEEFRSAVSYFTVETPTPPVL